MRSILEGVMKAYFVALLAFFPTSEALASEWIGIGTDTNGSIYEIDHDSVRTKTDSYRKTFVIAWSRQDHSEDRTVPHRSSKIMYHVRCYDREIAIASVVNYNSDGRISFSHSPDYPEFKPVTPDSMGEAILEHVCSLVE